MKKQPKDFQIAIIGAGTMGMGIATHFAIYGHKMRLYDAFPEALDKGCFVLAGIRAGGVEQAVETAVAMNANGDDGIPVPYYTEDVSNKVVKIIQSYTGVVNKMVWRKY